MGGEEKKAAAAAAAADSFFPKTLPIFVALQGRTVFVNRGTSASSCSVACLWFYLSDNFLLLSSSTLKIHYGTEKPRIVSTRLPCLKSLEKRGLVCRVLDPIILGV
jgi:hypothetical protein